MKTTGQINEVPFIGTDGKTYYIPCAWCLQEQGQKAEGVRMLCGPHIRIKRETL
jgi:hypothetical protein